VEKPFADPTPSSSTDKILLNGNLYTVNDGQPQAEAIAIKGDRILFVGSGEDAKSRRKAQLKRANWPT
jgi:predicted amidohydrolase YtcJ